MATGDFEYVAGMKQGSWTISGTLRQGAWPYHYTCCEPEPTLDEQIAEAERKRQGALNAHDKTAAEVDRHTKTVADLKEQKRKAEQNAAIMADRKMVDELLGGVGNQWAKGFHSFTLDANYERTAAYLRNLVAAAKAVAKAEQREKDAKVADAEQSRQYISCGNPVCVAADIARHIREQK